MELELVSITESSQGCSGNGWQECWPGLIIQRNSDQRRAGVPQRSHHKQSASQRTLLLVECISFAVPVLQLGFGAASVAGVMFVVLGFSCLLCHPRLCRLVLVWSSESKLEHGNREPAASSLDGLESRRFVQLPGQT